MRIVTALLAVAATMGSGTTWAEGHYSIGGFYDNKTAWTTGKDSERSEFRNTLQLEGDWRFSDETRLAGIIRARSTEDLEPGTVKEIDLREFYINHRTQRTAWILGRQQVVWGKSDGFRVLNVVNPLDLIEFILPPYIETQIPLWMVNGEVYWDPGALQMLIIPDVRQNDPAAPGGRFFIPPPLPRNIPFELEPVAKPDTDTPENWEYGLRWSGRWRQLDYTLNYLRAWSEDPVYFRTLSPTGVITVSPRIQRETLYGLSADLPAGPFVLRTEMTFTPDRYLPVVSPDVVSDFAAQKVLDYVVGLDWTIGRGVISAQAFQERVLDAPKTLLGDDQVNYYTLLLRVGLLQDRLTLQLFGAHGTDQNDGWIAPRISYEFTGDLEVTLGYDGFSGPQDSLFGEFDDQDRVFLQTTWHFLQH